MPAINAITSDKLFRLIGTPQCPVVVDVREDGAFSADANLVPSAIRRSDTGLAAWGGALAGRDVVVVCDDGGAVSAGVAAWMRVHDVSAEILDGGMNAWREAGLPRVPESKLPPRDALGRTLWVTRARPKVDRIACPWLIRRFVDPDALFLYVSPSDVLPVAERFGAAAYDFDNDGVFWSHRGANCTFDVMADELGLDGFAGLQRLRAIVRGADTGQPDLVPEAAGLLAASLGLSRMFSDDLEQLEAGMLIYDAFYRWCRDATDETHNWASHQPKGRK
jgi:rhodanese-related sulfurtransferase